MPTAERFNQGNQQTANSHLFGVQSWGTHTPFSDYLTDLKIWCSCTEVPVNRQAGLIVLSTAGAARLITKDLSQDLLANGRACLGTARSADWPET